MVLFSLLLILTLSCTPRPPLKRGTPVRREETLAPLKVAIAEDAFSVELSLDNGGRVIWEEGSRSLGAGEPVTLEAGSGGKIALRRGESVLVLAPVASVQPDAGSSFRLNGTRYGGTLDIFHDGASLIVLNRIGIEEYLRGVVGWEIGFLPEEKIEAAKSQAVAARTYALTRVLQSEELWDLLGDESDQVYRGLEKTTDVIDRAIEETAGVIATYRGELLRTYYSSTCGGRTAPLEEVWFEREGAPYLMGVPDGVGRRFDPDHAFCRASPRFRWKEEWSGGPDIASIVSNLALETERPVEELGRLHNIEVVKRGRAGRLFTTRFSTDAGDIDIGGDRVRWVLRRMSDGGILRSTWVDIKVERSGDLVTAVTAEGRGFGHGIGLCQWGAMGMAEAGYNFTQILKHYYPGARLEHVSTRVMEKKR